MHHGEASISFQAKCHMIFNVLSCTPICHGHPVPKKVFEASFTLFFIGEAWKVMTLAMTKNRTQMIGATVLEDLFSSVFGFEIQFFMAWMDFPSETKNHVICWIWFFRTAPFFTRCGTIESWPARIQPTSQSKSNNCLVQWLTAIEEILVKIRVFGCHEFMLGADWTLSCSRPAFSTTFSHARGGSMLEKIMHKFILKEMYIIHLLYECLMFARFFFFFLYVLMS